MQSKKSKIKRLFQIVIPKTCPQCGKRSLTKSKEGIRCKNCGIFIETNVQDKNWFFSSQDKSIKLNLKEELIAKQRKIRDRLMDLSNFRKIL